MNNSKFKINPYKILNIDKNYNENVLKKAYYKKIMIVHPDKGNPKYSDGKQFKLCTLSYKLLLKKLKNSEEKIHNDLKEGLNEYINNEVNYKKDLKEFNLKEFNNIFEGNKITDNFTDKGYGEWLKNLTNNNNQDLKLKNYNNNSFNDKFNELKKVNNNSNTLKVYKEPSELISLKGYDSVMKLGESNIESYTGEINGLGFRDLREAFEESTLIDVNSINIKDRPTNIKDYNKERKKVKYNMSKEDILLYKIKKKEEEEEENKRLKRIYENDNKHFDQYSRIHNRLMG